MAQGIAQLKIPAPTSGRAWYRPPSRGANQRAAAPANEGTARYLNLARCSEAARASGSRRPLRAGFQARNSPFGFENGLVEGKRVTALPP